MSLYFAFILNWFLTDFKMYVFEYFSKLKKYTNKMLNFLEQVLKCLFVNYIYVCIKSMFVIFPRTKLFGSWSVQ